MEKVLDQQKPLAIACSLGECVPVYQTLLASFEEGSLLLSRLGG